MAISMLKIRRPLGRLIFNMGIAIPGKTVFLIETAPWYRRVRRPRAYCPALILLSYLTTNCSLHFEIDTFTHNDHDGYIQFSTNLNQKRLSYQNGSLTLSTFGLQWCIRHNPQVMTLPTFLCMKSIPGKWSLMIEK